MRGLLILLCAALAAVAAYYGQPLARDNPDATLVMATVMTVFAGFLVAIIAILGDPTMIPKGSWRIAEMRHDQLVATVQRHTSLFYVYLIALAFLFIGVLIAKEPHYKVSSDVKAWVERAYLFFGVFSFLLTLGLPHALGKIQLSRSEAEIEERRRAAGISKDKS